MILLYLALYYRHQRHGDSLCSTYTSHHNCVNSDAICTLFRLLNQILGQIQYTYMYMHSHHYRH